MMTNDEIFLDLCWFSKFFKLTITQDSVKCSVNLYFRAQLYLMIFHLPLSLSAFLFLILIAMNF